MGTAALDGLLTLLDGGLQPHGGEVLEQPPDVVGLVRGEVGATQGRGQHGGLLPVGGAGCGRVGGDDGEGHPGRGGAEPGEQAVGGVEGRGVGGAVDDGEDGVEAATRDVVRVPLAGPVGRVVVGREGEAGADGVAGVVHGEHRRARGRGEPHVEPGLLQGPGEHQRGVHQLFEAEHEEAAGLFGTAEPVDDPGGHRREGLAEAGPVVGGEAVPAAVGQPGGPAQFQARGWSGRPSVRGGARGAAVLLLDQPQAPGEDVLRHPDRAPRVGDDVDAGAGLLGEGGEPAGVSGGPHVDQGDDHVVVARVPAVQVAQGVEDGVAGGELVVHQDQRPPVRLPAPVEEGGVLGEQQVGGGVRVRLLEPSGAGDRGDRASRRVQVGRALQAVRDGVAERGGRLRVAEDHRPGGGVGAEKGADAAAESDAVVVDDRGVLRNVFAEDAGDEQVRPLGIAAQREAQQAAQLVVTGQLYAEPVGDPGSGPHHVVRLFSLGARPRALLQACACRAPCSSCAVAGGCPARPPR
ncbi:hypothetical protein SDIAM26S_04359 [Streptomyces diastaticus subsp. diastaticus]